VPQEKPSYSAQVLDDENETDGEGAYEPAGTPGYAGPEVFVNDCYGKKADCFGVGVIAYNLWVTSLFFSAQCGRALLLCAQGAHGSRKSHSKLRGDSESQWPDFFFDQGSSV
jgi:hypothetical protein